MNFKVKLTDTAKEDLKEIARYIAEQSLDKRIAANFVNALKEKTKQLELFPESGSAPKDRVMQSAEYRFLVHESYLLFYRFEKKEGASYIVAIFNSKRDYAKVLSRLLPKEKD